MNTELIENFLKFFGNNKILCIPFDNNKNSRMNKLNIANVNIWSKINKDLYFYINNGGTKINEMTPVAFFQDLDAGKREDGNYLSIKEVGKKKKLMLSKLKGFGVEPTFIVETRNGYQVYWLLKEEIDNVKWNGIQKKLCNYFKDVGSDSRCIKINQIYRIPTSDWYKKWTGLPSFTTKLVTLQGKEYSTINSKNVKRYKVEDIERLLKEESTTVHRNSYSDFWHKMKETNINNVKSVDKNTINNNTLLLSIKEFLLEVNQVLKYAGKKYSAGQAYELAEKIGKEFSV